MSSLMRRAATLVVVLMLVYGLIAMLPGNGIRGLLGADASDAEVSSVAHNLGVDRPWPLRFFTWLGRLCRGDLGATRSGVPIEHLLITRFPNTLLLGGTATILAAAVSVLAAAYTVLRAGDRPARAITVVANALVAVPEYLLASVLVLVFAIWLAVLPSVTVTTGSAPAAQVDMLVLPVLSLAIPQVARDVGLIRAALLEAWEAPSALAMRLDGLADRTVLMHNVLPVSLPTVSTVLAMSIGPMLGGTVLVEALFNYPGVGSVLAASVADRDPALASSMVAVIAAAITLVLVVSDWLCAWALRGRR